MENDAASTGDPDLFHPISLTAAAGARAAPPPRYAMPLPYPSDILLQGQRTRTTMTGQGHAVHAALRSSMPAVCLRSPEEGAAGPSGCGGSADVMEDVDEGSPSDHPTGAPCTPRACRATTPHRCAPCR